MMGLLTGAMLRIEIVRMKAQMAQMKSIKEDLKLAHNKLGELGIYMQVARRKKNEPKR